MQLKNIHSRIHEIHNQKVMLDFDLAALYEVETRALKQAVKRNLDRFPEDFMFQLTNKDIEDLLSQNVIPSKSYFGGALPLAFTEQGVAMLSSVLKSKKALQVNISIMRAFVVMKQYIVDYAELNKKIQDIETKYNKQFADVYEALNYLMGIKKEETKIKTRKLIGYK
ncbi:MAG: ORF6N domain-containing protein [Bacteroidota bacterium]|nr:ORF6N domain-containing protein [Bacteroidota bacterium]